MLKLTIHSFLDFHKALLYCSLVDLGALIQIGIGYKLLDILLSELNFT